MDKVKDFLSDVVTGKFSFWPLIIIGGIFFIALTGEGNPSNDLSALQEMGMWIGHKLLFGVQMFVAIVLGLVLVYATNFARARPWFDRHGAASEMSKIRKRVNNGTENNGDSIAVALQYAGNTLLIAAVVFGFILIQKP